VDAGTVALVVRWLEVRRKRGISNGGPLFCSLAGKPVDQSYIRHLLPRLAHKAGIERRVHAHGLRHAFAVDLVRSGAPLYIVRDALGHTSSQQRRCTSAVSEPMRRSRRCGIVTGLMSSAPAPELDERAAFPPCRRATAQYGRGFGGKYDSSKFAGRRPTSPARVTSRAASSENPRSGARGQGSGLVETSRAPSDT
jgi:Phage integrase family